MLQQRHTSGTLTSWRHLWAEFSVFCARHRGLGLFLALCLAASYGFAAADASLSLDEEIHLVLDQTRAWVEQGRFGIAALKLLRGDVIPLPFLNVFASCLLLEASCLTWCFAFARASGGRLDGSASLFAFAAFYCTLPTNAFYLTFNTYNVDVSAGSLSAAVAVLCLYLNVVEQAGVRFLWAGVLALAFSISVYQSLLFAAASGALGLAAVACVSAVSTRSIWRFLTVVALAAIGGMLLNIVMTWLVRPADGNYVDVFFNWGKLAPSFIIGWIGASLRAILGGSGFVGGQFVPVALAFGGLAAVALPRKRSHKGLIVLLFCGLTTAPFLLSFGMGTPMPLRTQQALPLAFGAFFLLAGLALPRLKVVLGCLAAIMALWHAEANTRLFLTRHLTYEQDVAISREVARLLVAQGWDGRQIAVMGQGRLTPRPERFLVPSETFGSSLLTWSGGMRVSPLMRHLGYDTRWPTPAEQQRAADIAKSMPIWPNPGAVRLSGDLAVVRLGPD